MMCPYKEGGHRHQHGDRASEDRGRDWGDVATSQEIPETLGAGGGRKDPLLDPPLEPRRERSPTLFSDLCPQSWERIESCGLSSPPNPPWVALCHDSLRTFTWGRPGVSPSPKGPAVRRGWGTAETPLPSRTTRRTL